MTGGRCVSPDRDLSRRAFLKAMPLATAAAAAVACRRVPYRADDFRHPASSPVALLPAASYDIDLEDVVGRGLDLLQVDVRGRRVLLKPNMVEFEVDKAINTHPLLVAAAAATFLRRGAAEVVIGEGPGHRRDIEYLLGGTGMREVLRDLRRVRFVDLNHDDVQLVPLKCRYTGLDGLWLPSTVVASDFVVSMPKLKTHHWVGLTCSMKNLFGVVPGAVYGWPKNLLHVKGIEQSIVDLAATVRPALAIVDGIVGMEGDGPIMGRPRGVGMIAMGTDLLAVDGTCAQVVGFDPARLPYLSVASAFLGNLEPARIDQRAESLSRFATKFDVVQRLTGLQTS
jgi:uncharacterized protein (DUF362 family)